MNGPAEKVMVALDMPDAAMAEHLVDRLAGIPCWFKVGMELFYAAGPDLVRRLKAGGHRVFLDLKMHDIPNTVKGGAKSLTMLGADMFNVHAAGGTAMMAAAAEGVREALASGNAPFAGGQAPIVIAVTQLTSTSRTVMNEEIGIPGPVEQTVLRYAELAAGAGLSGVVASPLEAGLIKEKLGARFVVVTPGIRPAGADRADQSRVATPAEAVRAGADYLVIGRPVTASPDPRAALISILEELNEG
jgi:orotidine-5'-phosphate decarboxylase